MALAAAAVIPLAAACAHAGARPLPGTVEHTLVCGGVERSYLVHAPAGMDTGGLPLVLVFHGRYGTAEALEAQTGFSGLADSEGFIAVYPQGEGRRWADGRGGDDGTDIVFVERLLDAVGGTYGHDPSRVYATGMSNGAFFCCFLAEGRPDLLEAVAPVAGGMADPWPGGFAPGSPVAVLLVNGTEDPLVPYEGGRVGFEGGRRDNGGVMPAELAASLWAEACGCGEMTTVEMPDEDPEDGCTCTWMEWEAPPGGSRVALIRIEGGGHAWPGVDNALGEGLVGRTCNDFHSPSVIWSFFVHCTDAGPPDGGRGAGRGGGTR
jgi:polyhydroxybutyrate depolymerase